VLLFNTEPEFDSAVGAAGLAQARMVVTLSPFKTNLAFSDVLLPITPFTETPGTFVNAEGRIQSFHAVVKPRGDSRPGWKVLRVLGNLLGLPGFAQDSVQDVLRTQPEFEGQVASHLSAERLSNATQATIDLAPASAAPCVAGIYALDGLVRRASSLQMTADAKKTQAMEVSA
jgi:NADH-quinone oxidoreductase subunit G